MNPRSLGVLVLYLPFAWSYLSSLGLQCAPDVPGSYRLNNGRTVELRRSLVQLEAIGDVREGSTASEGRGFMGSRRARKTASREKKQQHRLQKATSTGNAAAVESKQEQEIGTRLVQGNKENLLQEIDLSNSPYTVTGGQHSEVDKSNVNIDKNLVAVEEVNMGTVHTGGVTTTIQAVEGEVMLAGKDVTELPGVNMDDIFSEKTRTETSKMQTRNKQLTSLNSLLKKSVSRKERIEDSFAVELEKLSSRLQQESQAEQGRLVELRDLLNECEVAISEKLLAVERERDILTQMSGVGEKVSEESIRSQFANAVATKADLISIETNLVDDMEAYRNQLSEDLNRARKRADMMNDVLEDLPKLDNLAVDHSKARLYSWNNLYSLQSLLLEDLQTMAAKSASVIELRCRYDEALQQKKSALKKLEKGGMKMLYGQDIWKKLKEAPGMSNSELQAIALQNAASSIISVGKVIRVGLVSLGEYAKSKDGQRCAESVVDMMKSVKSASASYWNSWLTGVVTFKSNMIPGEEMTSMQKVIDAWRDCMIAVLGSTEVNASLDEAQKNTMVVSKAIENFGGVMGTAFSGTANNVELHQAIADAAEGLQWTLIAVTGLVGKAILSSGE